MTLYETILKNAKEHPGNLAYRYFHYSRTHADFLRDVDRTADALYAMGIRVGDHVALALPNCPKMLSLLYATNKIGAVVVFINPKAPAEELARQLAMTNCKALFFSSIAYDAVIKMKALKGKGTAQLASMQYVVVSIYDFMPPTVCIALAWRSLGKPKGNTFRKLYKGCAMNFKEFIHASSKAKAEIPEFDENREAIVIFSGGTNGTFKAVVHSSAGLYYSAVHCLKTEEPLPESVSMLAILPAFHIFGLSVAIHLPLVAGGFIELVPVFNLGIVTNIIKRDCPTFFPGVPTIFERLLKHPKFAGLAKAGKLNFKQFRHGFVGGDNLTDEVRDAFNEVIRQNGGDGYISMGYGMSECCPICVNNRESAEEECIGLPFDTNKVLVLAETAEALDAEAAVKRSNNFFSENDILPDGELGEIAIASSYLMLYGFDEDGVRNEPFFFEGKNPHTGVKYADRFLRTGDMGYVRDGKVFYRCRNRRIIKVSGNTIFADSIERTMEQFVPGVKKAYVVPVPHKDRGYVAFAFAETDDSTNNEKLIADVQRICREYMIPHAIPVDARVVKEEEVPRTAIGKIAWGKLEARARELLH